MANTPKKGKSQVVKYNKWGYIFLIPFIVVYLIFQLIPLFTTIYNSFFDTILLAVCKLIIIKIDCSTTLSVVGMTEEQIYAAYCTEGKKNDSYIFKK